MEATPIGTSMVDQVVILAVETVTGIVTGITTGIVNLEEDIAMEDLWIKEVEVTREGTMITEVDRVCPGDTITTEVAVEAAIETTEDSHLRLVIDAVKKVIGQMNAQMVIHRENHLIIDLSEQYKY